MHPLARPNNKSGALGLNAGDAVIHCPDGRRGVMDEALQDGDALITWDDGTHGIVLWNNLIRDSQPGDSFLKRVRKWCIVCFGQTIASDKVERNHRFLEEALELVQSLGCTASEAHQLVDYVFGRPVGDPPQETGGVMVTLAALCAANELDMDELAEAELKRVFTLVEKIRAKQAAKPKHSPLPQKQQ